MDFSAYQNLWVFIETDDGKAASVGLELLHPGVELAHQLGQKAVAVILGKDNTEAEKAAIAYGADQVLSVEDPAYEYYNTEAYTYGMTKLVEKYQPSILMIGATIIGRDFGPRLSCRLKTGLTADCTSLAVDTETGIMGWTRPAFGGNLMATIMCENTRPQMGTVRPGVFKKIAPDSTRTAEVIKESIPVPTDVIRTTLIESIREAAAEMVKLEDAEIIVSGGRGFRQSGELLLYPRPGRCAGRCRGRLPCSCGRRLDSPCPPSGTDRQDRRSQALHRLRHLWCHPAPGRHERFGLHRCHQQGPGCPNFLHCRLRYCGRSVSGLAGDDCRSQKAEGVRA